MNTFNRLTTTLLISTALGLAGCEGTAPTLGGASGMSTTGAVAGSQATGASSALEHCDKPLGTAALVEDQHRDWWHIYSSRYPHLGSTIPVIRTFIQQSNCFVIVERGLAMRNIMQERELQQSGELRQGSQYGKGQLVAADYTISPSIQFSQKGTSGLKGLVGGVLGPVAGAVAGGLKANEAATTLLLIDNRSGVQIAAAVGSAQNFDFDMFGGLFAGGFVGAKGFTNTPEGKVITAAFVDSYNQMVKALRNYKAQTVEGGLGKGGKLKVGD